MESHEQLTATPSQPQPPRGSSVFFSELIRFVLIAVFVVLPIRVFIAQPFIVSGSSMDPTFENGEYLIVDEISYRFEEPLRGDVVIFKYPNDPSKYFIKRVIGLPGETVVISGNSVQIKNEFSPDGMLLDESYLSHLTLSRIDVTLADDEYFVMGDNRTASSDSRIWGPLPRDLIIGRAFVRLLPVTKMDLFPGVHRYESETESATTTQ